MQVKNDLRRRKFNEGTRKLWLKMTIVRESLHKGNLISGGRMVQG